MTGTRRLVARILLSTALFTAVGVLVASMVASLVVARFVIGNAQRMEPPQARQIARACRDGRPPSRPLRFGPVTVALFDATTLEPQTQGARLDPQLRERIGDGRTRRAMRLGWPLGKGTTAVVRRADSGACGIVQYTLDTAPLLRPAYREAVLILLVLTMGGACIGAYVVTARPLLRRVAEASAVARKVGGPDFTAARIKDWDDLAAISRSLSDADARIKADADLLRRRAQEVEGLMGAIAHDLKTPIATMQLNLQRAASDPNPDARADGIARAMGEILYVTGLMENMETAARIRGGLMDVAVRPVDLGSAVERAVTRFSVLGAHRGIEVVGSWPDEPVRVPGDPILIDRILTNLVHNAIRHGRRTGHVALVLAREATRFRLVVRDDGPGFPGDVLARLESPAPPDLLAEGRGPGGLGLPIVRHLCAKLGFTARFGNDPETGAWIDVTGPLA